MTLVEDMIILGYPIDDRGETRAHIILEGSW